MINETNFSEKLLHFIWEQLLFDTSNLKTVEGQKINILRKGFYNTNSGADFKDAIVQIDEMTWAGNIEIHIRTSDWNKHFHHQDKNYNNTILHVVYIHDRNIETEDHHSIPVLELLPRIPLHYIEKYKFLMQHQKAISCSEQINDIRDITKTTWLNRLIVERLEHKIQPIEEIYKYQNQHWEHTLYILLASNFGFQINKQPMQILAESLPISILHKQINHPTHAEALLLGQAGLLNDAKDEYLLHLKNEYIHLQKKYQLTPLSPHIWKYMRTRPKNFPAVRISQFASLLEKNHSYFSTILEIKSLKEAELLFTCEASEYWNTHYKPNEISEYIKKKIGIGSIHNIIANTIIPFMFFYGRQNQREDLTEKALELLDEIPAEKNRIIAQWQELGWPAKNMADSQALLQLFKNYCGEKRCAECLIGKEILTGIKKVKMISMHD